MKSFVHGEISQRFHEVLVSIMNRIYKVTLFIKHCITEHISFSQSGFERYYFMTTQEGYILLQRKKDIYCCTTRRIYTVLTQEGYILLHHKKDIYCCNTRRIYTAATQEGYILLQHKKDIYCCNTRRIYTAATQEGYILL